MDYSAARKLIELNNGFYREHHDSFSRTRVTAWPGWRRACSHMSLESRRCSVLDAACGNMRFERFLIEEYPQIDFEFHCVDSCADLFEPVCKSRFHETDILGRLLEGRRSLPVGPGYDAAFSFGFMHHVPTVRLREAFLEELVGSVAPGGVAAVSFWRFLDDVKLAEKAEATTRDAMRLLDVELEEGDRIVGWNGLPGAFRYCHSFSQVEIDHLVESVNGTATCIDRFESDGRNGAMNGYAVFRRR